MKKLLYSMVFVLAGQSWGASHHDFSAQALETLTDILENNTLHEMKDLRTWVDYIEPGKRSVFCWNALSYLFKTDTLHKVKNMYPLLLYDLGKDRRQDFCLKVLNFYFDSQRLHEIEDMEILIYNLASDKKTAFCSDALKFYYDNHRVHELKNISLLIKNFSETEKKCFCSRVLNYYWNRRRLHEVQDLFSLISYLDQKERKSLCFDVFNYYLNNKQLHEVKDLYALIQFLSFEQEGNLCLQALNDYFSSDELHKFKYLGHLIEHLPKQKRSVFSLKAFNYYHDTLRLHRVKNLDSLIRYIDEGQDSNVCSKIFNGNQRLYEIQDLKKVIYRFFPLKNQQKADFCLKIESGYPDTLFKNNDLIELSTGFSEWIFLLSPAKFIQKIRLLDAKTQEQLRMCYIRNFIQTRQKPVDSEIFTEELLKPLSLKNILSLVEHIHESTDIPTLEERDKGVVVVRSVEKIKPLCQAYLMHYGYTLPASLPMQDFTDLFDPFVTRLDKTIDGAGKDVQIPETEITVCFKDGTPEKIRDLYAQFNRIDFVGNILAISR